jgi:Fe-S cluster assembly ATP-binding protein
MINTLNQSFLLQINNLSIYLQEQHIVNNFSLPVAPGTVHALMGPNGSGKSTLAHTLMGHPHYTVTAGQILLNGEDITNLPIHKRAQLGVFLAFQHPLEIPGVTVAMLLKQAHQAVTGTALSVKDFNALLTANLELLEMSPSVAHRAVNEGFSGGEKKKLEVLQLLILQPKLVILDEIDSGLDVDALRIVANALMHAKAQRPDMCLLIITHYARILHYLKPDFVHIMRQGQLVATGTAELAQEIERNGYDNYTVPAVDNLLAIQLPEHKESSVRL